MSAFRTTLPSFQPDLRMDHQQGIACFGSCFAAHMAKRLQDAKFDCLLNPFGIQYNPLNIANCIDMILDDYIFSERDLVARDGKWFSLWHHSTYSDQRVEELKKNLLAASLGAKQKIMKTEVFVFTFGTAYYYEHKATNIIAANCHKLPSDHFVKKQFDPEEITTHFSNTLKKILVKKPNAKFIFTVSPIRHAKDGLIENTRSKAALHLSIKSLLDQFSQAVYFPSYEIMMDDLRDYRFYGPDMLHPSIVAIDYIWNHFTDHIFSQDTHEMVKKINAIQLAVQHRPFDADSEAHQKFILHTLEKIEDLEKRHTILNFSEEKKLLNGQLL